MRSRTVEQVKNSLDRSKAQTADWLSPAVSCSTAHLVTATWAATHNCGEIQMTPLSKPRCSMPFMFEKLDVYQKALDFADQLASLTKGFPRGYGFHADQLNRAALLIATNLAEGNGRFTKPDRRIFFTIARDSPQECVRLLEIARRRALIKDPAALALKDQREIIARMISGLINGLDKRDG